MRVWRIECQPGEEMQVLLAESCRLSCTPRRLLKNPRTSRVSYWGRYRWRDEGASPEGAVTEERRREMPQRAHALRVAPIFGPRYVAKLVHSAAATAYAWLLATFRKLTAT